MKRNLRLYTTIFIFALCVLPVAKAQEFTFEAIDPPGAPSSAWNNASGINNSGQIVGSYVKASIWYAYLFDKGIYTEMVDPDAQPMGTSLCGINNYGRMIGVDQMVGNGSPYGWSYGIMFDQGTLTRILSIPNGRPFFTFGINNQGQITGTYGKNDGSNFWASIDLCGFLLDGDTLTDINPPNAVCSSASIVNDYGQIVGDYRDTNGKSHGFLYDKGIYTDIDFPGAIRSNTYGINNRGQIVGQYRDSNGVFHGFLFDGGEFITIDHPDATWTRANGINDHGQIVGNYMGADNLFHGFMAKTVPLASSVLSSHSKMSTTWASIKAE